MRQALRELTQLNESHPYSFSRDELVAVLDQALAEAPPSSSRPQEPETQATPGVSLHEAARVGDVQAVREIIEAGGDLNEREPWGGSSPLITAATFGHTGVARLLIEAGADLDQQNNDGSTALITAAFFCQTEIVEALLAAGADKEVTNNAGSTALAVVTAPFDAMKGVYDFIGEALGPYGLKLDYDRIRSTRPKIAEMLR